MPSLPLSADFTNSAVTEAEFKTAITNQREFIASLLGTTGNQIDALKAIGALGNDTVTKNSAYTVVASDRGVTLLCNGTFTVSLTSAATLGDGFTFAVVNIGSGSITIDPSGSETLDGQTTKIVGSNSSLIITSNGTNFYSLGGGGVRGNTILVFASSTTWTAPSGIDSAIFIIIGGGAGGPFSNFSSLNGGAGGVAMAMATGISGSYSITIGNGGNGGISGSTSGTAGGTSSITGTNLSISATGGQPANTSTLESGANGVGTITTGTAIKYLGISAGNIFYTAGGRRPVNIAAGAYSLTSSYGAGASGERTSTSGATAGGGTGGALVIIY